VPRCFCICVVACCPGGHVRFDVSPSAALARRLMNAMMNFVRRFGPRNSVCSSALWCGD